MLGKNEMNKNSDVMNLTEKDAPVVSLRYTVQETVFHLHKKLQSLYFGGHRVTNFDR